MKKEIEILKKELLSGVFNYPLKSYVNKTYYKTLESKLNIFVEKIDKLPDRFELFKEIKNNRDLIVELKNNLLEIIDNYLRGKQRKSFECFQQLIDNHHVSAILTSHYEDFSSNKKGKFKLFRLRQSESELLDRNEMFHIPFTKRHLVANQRYSIAGLPCLYLGTSIYVSWLELNRPNLSTIFISGYKLKSTIRVLDLAYDLNLIIEDFANKVIDRGKFVNKLLLWPLVMACSFQKKYPIASFHEEYIIPGQLLEWITIENVDIKGLKYLSTKIASPKKYERGINYVFPPDDQNDNINYCSELQRKFILTKPLSWDILNVLPQAEVIALGTAIRAESLEEALLNIYDGSKFGFVEEQVYSMTFDTI